MTPHSSTFSMEMKTLEWDRSLRRFSIYAAATILMTIVVIMIIGLDDETVCICDHELMLSRWHTLNDKSACYFRRHNCQCMPQTVISSSWMGITTLNLRLSLILNQGLIAICEAATSQQTRVTLRSSSFKNICNSKQTPTTGCNGNSRNGTHDSVTTARNRTEKTVASIFQIFESWTAYFFLRIQIIISDEYHRFFVELVLTAAVKADTWTWLLRPFPCLR